MLVLGNKAKDIDEARKLAAEMEEGYAAGIFNEDTGIVYTPSVCTAEALRTSAIEADLVKPGAQYHMVRP